MSVDILIVDDEADIRNLIQGILEDEGYSTLGCGTSERAYQHIANDKPSLIILDIWLQGSADDGLEILKKTHEAHPHIPVLMISGHGTIETAVAAIKDGAYDFIEKPFKSDRLLLMIKRALEASALRQENEALRQQAPQADAAELAGSSPATEKLQQVIERAAPTNSRVLLTGEAGTGKNVVARILHQNSSRAEQPFLVVNCASLNPERLETELFGDEGQDKAGLLERANGGTLLLDEVADMSMATQAKIVRVLQEQRFKKAGTPDFINVDVRVLATTNKDLEQGIKDAVFREDLYYRLNVVPLHISPLRERSADIPVLVESFISVISASFSIEGATFNDMALQKLKAYSWPGNVRQLRNVVEWVLIMHGDNEGQPYGADELPSEILGHGTDKQGLDEQVSNEVSMDHYMEAPLRDAREMFEREYLLSQIERFEGNISKTAQFIGMERSALHRKIKTLNIHEGDDNKTNNNDVRKRA